MVLLALASQDPAQGCLLSREETWLGRVARPQYSCFSQLWTLDQPGLSAMLWESPCLLGTAASATKLTPLQAKATGCLGLGVPKFRRQAEPLQRGCGCTLCWREHTPAVSVAFPRCQPLTITAPTMTSWKHFTHPLLGGKTPGSLQGKGQPASSDGPRPHGL